MRACYIAIRVAQTMGIEGGLLGSVYYAALLRTWGAAATPLMPQALAVIEGEVGKAVDGACFEALRELVTG